MLLVSGKPHLQTAGYCLSLFRQQVTVYPSPNRRSLSVPLPTASPCLSLSRQRAIVCPSPDSRSLSVPLQTGGRCLALSWRLKCLISWGDERGCAHPPSATAFCGSFDEATFPPEPHHYQMSRIPQNRNRD